MLLGPAHRLVPRQAAELRPEVPQPALGLLVELRLVARLRRAPLAARRAWPLERPWTWE